MCDTSSAPWRGRLPLKGKAREELKADRGETGSGNTAAEICAAALRHWGRWHQMVKCVEEMAELTQELCKRLDGVENNTRLAEELADAEITFAQVKLAFGLEEETEHWKGIKLKRLEERIRRDDDAE